MKGAWYDKICPAFNLALHYLHNSCTTGYICLYEDLNWQESYARVTFVNLRVGWYAFASCMWCEWWQHNYKAQTARLTHPSHQHSPRLGGGWRALNTWWAMLQELSLTPSYLQGERLLKLGRLLVWSGSQGLWSLCGRGREPLSSRPGASNDYKDSLGRKYFPYGFCCDTVFGVMAEDIRYKWLVTTEYSVKSQFLKIIEGVKNLYTLTFTDCIHRPLLV